MTLVLTGENNLGAVALVRLSSALSLLYTFIINIVALTYLIATSSKLFLFQSVIFDFSSSDFPICSSGEG